MAAVGIIYFTVPSAFFILLSLPPTSYASSLSPSFSSYCTSSDTFYLFCRHDAEHKVRVHCKHTYVLRLHTKLLEYYISFCVIKYEKKSSLTLCYYKTFNHLLRFRRIQDPFLVHFHIHTFSLAAAAAASATQ